jgi:hypothetical protein
MASAAQPTMRLTRKSGHCGPTALPDSYYQQQGVPFREQLDWRVSNYDIPRSVGIVIIGQYSKLPALHCDNHCNQPRHMPCLYGMGSKAQTTQHAYLSL